MTANRPVVAEHTIEELLARARTRLDVQSPRLSARAAYQAQLRGALFVDIRPAAQRASEGGIPGALVIERDVLEWWLDPASDWRLPQVGNHDHEVVILCSEGYTSSLAAAVLHDLGLHRATDVVGGFHAWAAAGLPVVEG
jgi:rhodanese-related sulfurtransferase